MKFLRRKSKKVKAGKGKAAKTVNAIKEEPELPPCPTMETTEPVVKAVVEEEEDPWSEETVMAVAALYKLTEPQLQALMDLQDRLADIDHWKNEPYEVIRFLKEVKYNVKPAEDRFRKMVHWRVENDMDHFTERYGTPHALFDLFPSVVLKGLDKEGDPIFVERSGAFDAYGFYKHFGTTALVEFITWKREKDLTRLPHSPAWQQAVYEPTHQGRRVGQCNILFDVQGLNRNHCRAGLLPLFGQLARLTQDYYAGVAKRIIVLRAPAFFKFFWNLVKHFFDPAIRELITVTSEADYLDVLDQHFDCNVFPTLIHPEGEDGGFMPGFDNVILEGGFLTKDVLAKYGEGKHTAKHRRSSSATMDITETVSCTEGSRTESVSLESDDDSSTTSAPETYAVTEGVRIKSGVLLGGTFAGEVIYLN